jgi:hypothetical protein
MGNACLGKKSNKPKLHKELTFPETPSNKTAKNIIITSTPPIETPDLSVYMQTVNNQTPKSEYSRRSSARLHPLRRRNDSSPNNHVASQDYSFMNSSKLNSLNQSNEKSFRIFGTNGVDMNSRLFQTLKEESVLSLNSISKNDLLLITEENMEILHFLSQKNKSGPYYFEDDIPQSKTDLDSGSKKYIIKSSHFAKSIDISFI